MVDFGKGEWRNTSYQLLPENLRQENQQHPPDSRHPEPPTDSSHSYMQPSRRRKAALSISRHFLFPGSANKFHSHFITCEKRDVPGSAVPLAKITAILGQVVVFFTRAFCFMIFPSPRKAFSTFVPFSIKSSMQSSPPTLQLSAHTELKSTQVTKMKNEISARMPNTRGSASELKRKLKV